MKKLLLLLILLLLPTLAFAGPKLTVSPEYNSTTYIDTTYYPNGDVYDSSEYTINKTTVRFYLGYEFDINEDYKIDVVGSTDIDLLGRLETNLIYDVSDKLAIKAGPHIVKNFSSSPDLSYSQGFGYQIGAEYQLKNNSFVDLKYANSKYDYNFKNLDFSSGEAKSSAISIGVGVRF